MAYSNVGIANIALGLIGVKPIAAFYPAETTPQAIDVHTFWDVTRDSVLEEDDWVFAKRRQRLAKLTLATALSNHLYGYQYAYGWPTDALRVCRSKSLDPSTYPSESEYSYAYLTDNYIYQLQRRYPYSIETLNSGLKAILTNFDNSSYSFYGSFVFRVTDPEKYSALFIEAFATKLGANIAVKRTETRHKREDLLKDYGMAITKAKELNAYMSFNLDEGDDSWITAGR